MFWILPAGHMATQEANLHSLGGDTSRQLWRAAAHALATGEPGTVALKAATLKQLSAIMAVGCAKGGFPTLNRHLHMDELAGLGWRDLEPLCAEPEQGEAALTASLAMLVGSLSHVQT